MILFKMDQKWWFTSCPCNYSPDGNMVTLGGLHVVCRATISLRLLALGTLTPEVLSALCTLRRHKKTTKYVGVTCGWTWYRKDEKRISDGWLMVWNTVYCSNLFGMIYKCDRHMVQLAKQTAKQIYVWSMNEVSLDAIFGGLLLELAKKTWKFGGSWHGPWGFSAVLTAKKSVLSWRKWHVHFIAWFYADCT